jgi:hypothetical protein
MESDLQLLFQLLVPKVKPHKVHRSRLSALLPTSHIHSRSHSHSLSLARSLALSLALSRSLSLARSLALSLALARFLSLTLTLSRIQFGGPSCDGCLAR